MPFHTGSEAIADSIPTSRPISEADLPEIEAIYSSEDYIERFKGQVENAEKKCREERRNETHWP